MNIYFPHSKEKIPTIQKKKKEEEENNYSASFLIASTASVVVFFDGGGQVNPREVGDVEGGLLLQPLDVGLPEDGPLDRRAVAALVSGVVLDVVDGLGVGGGYGGLDLGGGRAVEAVLEGVGDGGAVLRGGAGAGDLPWLLKEAPQGLEEGRRR